MSRIPVSGVRTSWANAASAASTMPAPAVFVALLVALLLARLRDLGVVMPEARFLGGRIFCGRILGDRILSDPVRRRARDFSAMIPPGPWVLPPCHGPARRVTPKPGFPLERPRPSRRRSGPGHPPADRGPGPARS